MFLLINKEIGMAGEGGESLEVKMEGRMLKFIIYIYVNDNKMILLVFLKKLKSPSHF